MATLVAYYSRADENYFGGSYRYVDVGNTEKVAKKIAALTGGELFKIEQVTPYAKDYDTCISQAKKDKQSGARPALVRKLSSLDAYDEIYLGYPNYWGTMPMAVYTFLESLDWTGKVIHPFCTHEGSGLASTPKDVERAAKGATVARGLAVNGSYADSADKAIKDWIKG